jgi:hypothetical protein
MTDEAKCSENTCTCVYCERDRLRDDLNSANSALAVFRKVEKQWAKQWGVWVTSSCDRDDKDGWMWGGSRPWRGSETDARAWAEELSRMGDRQRFAHEPRPVHEGCLCIEIDPADLPCLVCEAVDIQRRRPTGT